MTTQWNPDELLDGIAQDGKARLVTGAPGAGKTEFALSVLTAGLRRFGGAGAVMVVPGRVVADLLGNRVIRDMGSSVQARPVTTLGAVAFRVIAASRAASGLPLPRLLNGAEQDALLRQVMAVHMAHAAAGDDCAICALLREYFAQADWASLVQDADGAVPGGSTSADVFARGISDAFIAQLRDMLARLDELGVNPSGEAALLADVAQDARLLVQWRLAFALRREYIAAQSAASEGQYRLDASYLLVAGAREIHDAMASGRSEEQYDSWLASRGLPQLLVVDDAQDITLAGMRFLEELNHAGTAIVLVGNPDEAVQTFRGSYPEYLMRQAVTGPMQAVEMALPSADFASGETYASLVASRVSLSIPSEEGEPLPLARRPGKLVSALDTGADIPSDDGTVQTGLYRSAREELDDVVWRMKRAHLDHHIQWNDMVVIAHDNTTVRTYGERLRRDGVPVRYSSVTRPLNSESFVQGLFALIELARLRAEGVASCTMSLAETASYVRTRVSTVMNGPLVTAGAKPGQGRPARLAPIESAMAALESLAPIAGDKASLHGLISSWETLRESSVDGHERVVVDDSIIGFSADADLAFGADALYVMLAFDDAQAPAENVLDAITAVLGADPQARAFMNLWTLVGKISRGLSNLPPEQRSRPSYALAVAWNAAAITPVWQKLALANTPDGRAANDRLDVAMRLFQFAEDSTASRDIMGFIAQVRAMQVQADSLAHIGPVENAVTLTTPAGTAGRHWQYAWLPSLQQDVWPNLAGRNTMFGGEDLAELVLRGTLNTADAAGHDPQFIAVLSSEKKSFLVALTRACRSVTVSAVWNDDLSPSDFLFGYMPEYYPRDKQRARFTDVGEQTSESGLDLSGLDGDPRGLVTAARVIVATSEPDSSEARDAAETLAVLAENGIAAANPDNWAFASALSRRGTSSAVSPASGSKQTEDDERTSGDDHAPLVTLSPSAVDGLWACPVCWLLEHQFAGPQPGLVNAGFGTLIHAVAQQGSEEGLDRLDSDESARNAMGISDASSVQQRIEAVTKRMIVIYQEQRPDPESIADTRERYTAKRKDDSAADILANIASYFVLSGTNTDAYLDKNVGKFEIGTLTKADCELSFTARFDLHDIVAAYNALPGMRPVDRDTLASMMGFLVGGWPSGMRNDLTVRLSGRIDRMETRILADGSENIRLIDYKTGAVPTVKQIFNDLQLVCYQLGLVFPEEGLRGSAALANAPRIGQSALFHVAYNDAPARSYAPEGVFQPPLFTNGSLNAEPFTDRAWYKDPAKFFDMPIPDSATPPAGVDTETWKQFVSLTGTQALWSLTMIARVFYAAAASRSSVINAHPQATHVAYCRMTGVCPACAGKLDTVFETRQA